MCVCSQTADFDPVIKEPRKVESEREKMQEAPIDLDVRSVSGKNGWKSIFVLDLQLRIKII